MDMAAFRRWLPWSIAMVAMVVAWRTMRIAERAGGLRVSIEVNTTCSDYFQLFWDGGEGSYVVDRSLRIPAPAQRGSQRITFVLPDSVRHVQGLRFDPGAQPVRMSLEAIVLEGPYRTHRLEAPE